MEKIEYKVMHDIEKSYWWFVGKQFLVKTLLKELSFERFAPRKVLDIGCGTGITLKLLEGFGQAYGMELSSEAIHFLRQREVKYIVQSDAGQRLPFKDCTFSAITCLDVLEHLDDDVNVLKEMARVCRPGGHVIITVPAFSFLWSLHDVALHHRRRYTKWQLLGKVSRLGYKVVKVSYYNFVLFFPILSVRRLKPFVFHERNFRSDFFLPLPKFANSLLGVLLLGEILCLRFLNFPFGVSLVLLLQKENGD
jgi:SAM-dependent methyltransferase